MSNLVCKTRGNSSPQGKGRVYFSCHPEDFGTYFERVSEDILEKQNCVIWYDKEPESDWDEQLATDISHMRLLVIPVTARLLHTENRTMKYEFPYAMEQNIPVLPILMDTSLEKEFNQYFGNLQWLNPYEIDNTAISYDKKLEQYLEEILLDDKLRERIRQELDGYIFFSYRKKDRKHARALMQKIHDQAGYRDFAIWYDEYLVPGENFDESIKMAIRKSEIFLLMITPNLVNEKNYVMDEEYPEAKRIGESILPIEVEATNRALLFKHYEGLPEIVDVEDTKEINSALRNLLPNKQLRKHSDTPEHLYYIGLAYLTGVDVETDSRRGVRLIQKAADAGELRAMKKLVSMYEKGEAVIRDYRMAVTWKKRVIEKLKEEYQVNKEEVTGIELVNEMRGLCYIFSHELMDETSVKDILMQALEVARGINGDRGNWCVATIYEELAQLANDIEEKRNLYEKAASIAEGLCEKNTGSDYRGTWLSCYSGIASCMEKEGKFDLALQYYLKVLDLYKLDEKEKGTELARNSFARAYLNVATCMMRTEQFAGAGAYLYDGFKIVETLEKEYKEAYNQGLYFMYLIGFSEFYEKLGELETVIRYAQQAESYAAEHMEKDDTVFNIQMYAIAAWRLAEVLKNTKPDESDIYYQKGKDALKRIRVQKQEDEDNYQQVIACLKKILECEAAGDVEHTEWYFEQALDLLKKMPFKKEDLAFYLELANKAYAYGADYYNSAEFKKALSFFDYASVIGNKIVKTDNIEEHLQFSIKAYKALAIVHEIAREYEQAYICYKYVQERLEELYEMTGREAYKTDSRYSAACSKYNLGINNYEEAMYEDAEKNYKEAEKDLLSIDFKPEMLVQIYERLIIVLESQRKMPEAKEYLTKELNLLMFIEKREVAVVGERDVELLVDVWTRMIRVCGEIAEYETAYESYTEAMRLLEMAEEKVNMLLKVYRGESTYAKLMNIWYKMYETLKEAGDESGAALYYKKYDELYEQLYGV